MADLSELLFHTEEFFKRHWWCPDETTSPIWKYNYTWDGAVPYHDLGGVYALINEHQEIVYIGLGSSRGGRKYKEHGISRRLLKHVIKRNPAEDGKRYVTKPKWPEVVDIGAVVFPPKSTYLATALEEYLISMLTPVRNKAKKKNADRFTKKT